jgi:acyl-CoA synthetase (AMP-forming)/AMP-acid ligase II/acyl carrier protein
MSPHHPPATVQTMVDLLQYRAKETGKNAGFRFLEQGEAVTQEWSYAELERRARAVAAELQELLERGDRVLLMFPDGLDYFAALFGCMFAETLAVPAHPPDPARLARTVPRLQAIAEDAGIAAVLTHSAMSGIRDQLPKSIREAKWIHTDTIDPKQATRWSAPALRPDTIAYLQYTSGSTAAPKGVMVSHGNLLHQLADFDQGYDHQADSVTVTWLPPFHDLGLVYGFFLPLFIGSHSVSMPPLAFMQRPFRWLKAISDFRGTHAPAPNFAYDLCALKISETEREELDLHSWRVALNGAEPIRKQTEERFLDTFAPCGLRADTISHAFGMSEATAKVSSEHIGMANVFLPLDPEAYEQNEAKVLPPADPRARWVAGCGIMTGDTVIAIADPDTLQRLPDSFVGEIWITGATVAQGYFNNPEATETTFRAQLAGEGDRPYLRTGDLGFLRDGHLFITGRLKDMIIIRGQNHYPQDIEWTIGTRHPSLRPNCAAAFSVEVQGAERLVLVTEVYPDRVDSPESVFGALRQGIVEHGLQAYSLLLIPPRQLPKTSSGKIARRKSKHLFETDRFQVIAQWTAEVTATSNNPSTSALRERLNNAPLRKHASILTAHIRQMTAALLGLDATDLDPDEPLRELGLDSISAVELTEQVGRDAGVSLSTSTIFDYPTMRALADYLVEARQPPETDPELKEGARPTNTADADLDGLSEEEIEAMLLEELKSL